MLTAACLVIAGWLAFTFARSTVLAPSALTLTLIAVPFVLIAGFLIAGICGYMAGLIGASNSPISGVGILSIVHVRLGTHLRRRRQRQKHGPRSSPSRSS